MIIILNNDDVMIVIIMEVIVFIVLIIKIVLKLKLHTNTNTNPIIFLNLCKFDDKYNIGHNPQCDVSYRSMLGTRSLRQTSR